MSSHNTAEYQRRLRRSNPEYRNRQNAARRRRHYLAHHGEYVKRDHCELCPMEITMWGRQRRSDGRRLLVHHKYFESCADCGGAEKGKGVCTRPDHQITLCWPCHRTIHARYRARLIQDAEDMDRVFQQMFAAD